jgi:hypothetical protein
LLSSEYESIAEKLLSSSLVEKMFPCSLLKGDSSHGRNKDSRRGSSQIETTVSVRAAGDTVTVGDEVGRGGRTLVIRGVRTGSIFFFYHCFYFSWHWRPKFFSGHGSL